MTWVTSLLVIVVAAVGLLFGFQFYMVRRMQRMRGKPAPELDGRFGRASSRGRALFYFFSPACGACRTMTPVVTDMSRGDDRVFPIDVSRDFDVARRFGVMATPTTILVHKGLIDEVFVGPRNERALRGLMAS
ncbi:MAG: thioredoxin family protein [Deltaproteobacteria bacterium]|nr:thioredoxin family protein [Deltaproteobacteria bacterium]